MYVCMHTRILISDFLAYFSYFGRFWHIFLQYQGKIFLKFFYFFFGVESWAAAHGLYRCAVYRLLSEPMSTRLLNSISSRICRQNTQLNMYTTTSKQQEGCTFKDSHPKCFMTTNFDKFHREAFARGGERGDVLTACFCDIQRQRSIRMEFVIIVITLLNPHYTSSWR